MYAVDEETGQARWTYRTHHEGEPAPAYEDGLVFVGAGTMDAFDAGTGELVWQRYLLGDSPGSVSTEITEPAIDRGVLFLASDSHGFHLNGPTGERLRA